jgi:porphobilinogen synthase
MVEETHLGVDNLIYPLFVTSGENVKQEVPSLPGNFVFSCDTLLKEIEECIELGLSTFILFPKVPNDLKDKQGTYGYSKKNFYLDVARQIKERFPNIVLVSDVALDPYNSDGHDGIVRHGEILNDETLETLVRMAVLQAEAGYDMIGPSDMMDGRVGAIRKGLDDAGYLNTSIMSYTAKYASAFYGPFRDALDSAPVEDEDIPSDKKTYQMNPANRREALIEAHLDTAEGADFLMVKPAIHYLDVIHTLRTHSHLPIAAYHVSGECAQLIAACKNGWLTYEEAMPEALLSIRRAGADAILTYFAKDFAKLIMNQ